MVTCNQVFSRANIRFKWKQSTCGFVVTNFLANIPLVLVHLTEIRIWSYFETKFVSLQISAQIGNFAADIYDKLSANKLIN